jgi:hypothetical protein
MHLRLTIETGRTDRIQARRGVGCRRLVRMSHVRCVAMLVLIGLAMSAGPAAGQGLTPLGRAPAVPLEEAADVILVLKPHERHSLHLPATIDRIVEGEIVHLEKGVLPKMIVHTRNTFTSGLEAGVPVKLFLMAFKDGHAHYIIGVLPQGNGSKP